MNRKLLRIIVLLTIGGVCRAASAVPLLAVDINDRTLADAPNSVAGFSSYVLTPGGIATVNGPSTQVIGAYSVTLAPWDDGSDGNPAGAIDDRDRTQPVNGGAFTYAQIYDDFVFAGASVGPSGGIDLTINGGSLVPNKAYSVSIYAYDGEAVGSDTRRSATWRDRNNIDEFVLRADWIQSVRPTTNDTYKFTGVAFTDATGKLSVRGRGDPADASQSPPLNNGPPVYINAFEINEFVPGAELSLEVNTTTGEVRFLNEQSIGFAISFYEIRSPSGALNLGGWVGLDDQENNDPIGVGWDESPNITSSRLGEVNLTSIESFTPGSSRTLGAAFTIGAAQDLRFYYASPADTASRLGIVRYVTSPPVPGDYNNNGTVDAADYVVWRKSLTTQTPMPNDPIGLPIGQSQYNQWRANFGRLGAISETARLAFAPVPEPSACILLGMVISIQFCLGRPRVR